MAGAIPENNFDLSSFNLMGGYWTFEPWGVGSGMAETILPPPPNARVYLTDSENWNILFTARVTRQTYNHKTGLYHSELKDAMSTIFPEGIEFEETNSNDIMYELADAVDEWFDEGGGPSV